MKFLFIFLVTTICSLSSAQFNSEDIELIKKHAVQDALIHQQKKSEDKKITIKAKKREQRRNHLQTTFKGLNLVNFTLSANHCSDDDTIDRCWKTCDEDGYSFNTCKNQCGTNSTGSNNACWSVCDKDGYSFNTCKNECNTNTSEGSEACWSMCDKDGYSFNTCKNECGTETTGGSNACWDICDKDGYSFNTCKNECGTETTGGSNACWDMCNKDGYSFNTCQNACGTN